MSRDPPGRSVLTARADRLRLQHANEWQIAVTPVEVEPVTDHEFIIDVEAHIVGLDGARALLPFPQQHTNAHTGRAAFGSEPFTDGMKRAPAVEDVIEQEHMPAVQIRQ